MPPSMEGVTLLHMGSYALTLKTFFRPEQAQGVDETYELHIGDEVLQAQIRAAEIHIQQGEILKADVVFRTDIRSFLELLSGQIQPAEAVSSGRILIEGDPGALSRFVNICRLPSAVEGELLRRDPQRSNKSIGKA